MQLKCGVTEDCLESSGQKKEPIKVSWKNFLFNRVQQHMLSEINKKKLKYVGHANRNPRTNLMTTLLQGRVPGSRRRGRPATSYMNNVTANSGLRLSQVVHQSRDRDGWRATVMTNGAATAGLGEADR